MASHLGQLTLDIIAKIGGFVGPIDKVDRRVNKSRQNFKKYGKDSAASIQKLDAAIASTAAVALSMGLAVNKALSEFSTIDAGLIGVQKTTNATDREMAALKREILNIAVVTPVTTAKLLEIAQAAGQLGVRGVKNIALFTDTIAKLEMTTDIQGEEAAKSLARLLNTAGEAPRKVGQLGSALVALGNNMAASESEIMMVASEVGRSVAAFEVGSEASLAYGAALKSMGARAELSGSAIGRAMIEIEKAILEGGEKFEYLQNVTGMTGEQIRKTFKTDASEVFNAWIRGMSRLTKNGESAITLLERFGMTGVEQVKGLSPLIANVKILDDAFRIANAEIKNSTALTEEAMKASESFSSQMKITLNVVNKIAAGIGSGLAPEIIKVTKEFRAWVDENDKFISQDLPDYIKRVAERSKELVDLFNRLPLEVVASGIVGTMLFGKSGGVVLGGGMYLLNEFRDFFEGLEGVRAGHISMSEFIGDEAEFEAALDRYRSLKESASGVLDSIQKIDAKIALVQGEYNKLLSTPIKTFYKSDFDGRLKELDAYKKELAELQSLREKILNQPIISPTPGANHRNIHHQDIFGSTPPPPPPKQLPPPVDKKLAAKQAAAWQSAYNSLDVMTQATYDKMMSYAKAEYEQNLKLLGDKETAHALYTQSVNEINQKMFGSGVHVALESFFDEIDEAEEKYRQLMTEGVQVTERMRTPIEQISVDMAHFNELLDAGVISVETYSRAISKIADEDLGLDNLFISETDFDGQIAAENELYQQRLAMLEQYRQERSDLNAEWDEKEAKLTQQHQDKVAEIERARQQLMLTSAASMFDSMAEMVGTYAGESSGAYKALFAVSKAFSTAEAILNMKQAVSEAGTLPFPANIGAMATVAAQMGTIVSDIAAVGMAHDGIDSIPKTGTWLLEKGERVTTAETSAKLDRTLSEIQNNMKSGNSTSYRISIPVSVSGDERFANALSAEIENTVIRVMREEMR